MYARCALYARTSTTDKGQTPQNQLRQLRAFARSQGWQLAVEFVDAASGTRSDCELENTPPGQVEYVFGGTRDLLKIAVTA